MNEANWPAEQQKLLDANRAENDGKADAKVLRTIWPKVKFADTSDAAKQLKHVLSEMHEVHLAILDAAKAKGSHLTDVYQMLIMGELADVQHSIETLWRILDRDNGPGFSEKNILSIVETKNRDRGYYIDSEEP